jgi:plastocyanin
MRHLWKLAVIALVLSSAPAAAAPAASVEAPAATVTVNMTEFDFVPPVVFINVGDTVQWTNTGAVIHTSTSDTGLWNSGNVGPGGSFSFTFTAPGTYLYHCIPHEVLGMIGTVVVGAINTNGSFETDGNGDGTPDGWSRLGLTANDRLVNDANSGLRGFRITGGSGTKALFQRRMLSGSAGDTFTVSGWSKASGVGTAGFYGLAVRFENTDGTTTTLPAASFSRGTHDWERATGTVTAPKPYRAVFVAAALQNQPTTATATYDDVSITRP